MQSRKSYFFAKKISIFIKNTQSWCGPCKKLYPVLGQKVNSAEQKWNLIYINIDEFPDLAQSYEVKYI